MYLLHRKLCRQFVQEETIVRCCGTWRTPEIHCNYCELFSSASNQTRSSVCAAQVPSTPTLCWYFSAILNPPPIWFNHIKISACQMYWEQWQDSRWWSWADKGWMCIFPHSGNITAAQNWTKLELPHLLSPKFSEPFVGISYNSLAMKNSSWLYKSWSHKKAEWKGVCSQRVGG